MGNHLVKCRVRILRLLDADNLYLVELVKSVQTSHVLTIGTCLTTEAWGICSKLLRELGIVQDDVPVDIGNRNLSSRNEIEIVETYIVHLGLLVRQLACAET